MIASWGCHARWKRWRLSWRLSLEREAHTRDTARRRRMGEAAGKKPDQAAAEGGDDIMEEEEEEPALVSAQAQVAGSRAEAAAPPSQRCVCMLCMVRHPSCTLIAKHQDSTSWGLMLWQLCRIKMVTASVGSLKRIARLRTQPGLA